MVEQLSMSGHIKAFMHHSTLWCPAKGSILRCVINEMLHGGAQQVQIYTQKHVQWLNPLASLPLCLPKFEMRLKSKQRLEMAKKKAAGT